MLCCPECGAPKLDKVQRGPLYAIPDLGEVYCYGRQLRLGPMLAKIMVLLMRFGRTSHLALQALCTHENTSSDSIKSQVSHLRKRLPPGVDIRNIRGWGYELQIKASIPQEELDGKGEI